MARTIQLLAKHRVIGGVGVMALAAATWTFFAAPERERPVALPDLGTRSGQLAPSTPRTHRRAGACDGAEQATIRGPRPLTPPQGWFSSDDYPTLAVIAGHGGLTTTDLVIDTQGLVIGCGVSGSSGHVSLDRRSCAVFRQRARFSPAEDARGCPVPSVWHQRVRWEIPAN